MTDDRCSTCMVLLLELARVGANPQLWSAYEEYAATGEENRIDYAVAEAGPHLLRRAKESIARRGLMQPEYLGVTIGPEV